MTWVDDLAKLQKSVNDHYAEWAVALGLVFLVLRIGFLFATLGSFEFGEQVCWLFVAFFTGWVAMPLWLFHVEGFRYVPRTRQ
jgi:uncharacterized integral membrane protein